MAEAEEFFNEYLTEPEDYTGKSLDFPGQNA